jgi:Ca2+-binding EF-hand superfamily protein
VFTDVDIYQPYAGDIDKEELALLSEKLLGHALPDNEIDELMRKMDIDGKV